MLLPLVYGRPVPEKNVWDWHLLEKVEIHYCFRFDPRDAASQKEAEEKRRPRRFLASPILINPGTEGDYFCSGETPGITKIKIATPVCFSKINIVINHEKREWHTEVIGTSFWYQHVLVSFVYLWFRDEKTKQKKKRAKRRKHGIARTTTLYSDARIRD